MEYIDVLFDGPPGPEGPRFVEVHDDDGNPIRIGAWIEGAHGRWSLRIPMAPPKPMAPPAPMLLRVGGVMFNPREVASVIPVGGKAWVFLSHAGGPIRTQAPFDEVADAIERALNAAPQQKETQR